MSFYFREQPCLSLGKEFGRPGRLANASSSCGYWLTTGFGLHSLAPPPSALSFEEWWADAYGSVDGEARRGFNSVIILGAWSLAHRNRCVFDGISPSLNSVLTTARVEMKLWVLAGALGIEYLFPMMWVE
ncbi:hypothetical protein U9M48_036212 [Paspalum notatum var. saurae]|uniref:Uncharacterized protein n=1 Tax=Paspalum notatum var. saurae TaxID=547442 RepID=A0AAQ3UIQ2_PASNO